MLMSLSPTLSIRNLSIPLGIQIFFKKNFCEKEILLQNSSSYEKWRFFVPSSISLQKKKNMFFLFSQNKMILISTFSILKSFLYGLSRKYSLILFLKGLGFRALPKSGLTNSFNFKLGFSHLFAMKPFLSTSKVIELSSSKKSTRLKLRSSSKHLLGNLAFKIRNLKKPDSYKGKGILFKGEKLFLKVGKKT